MINEVRGVFEGVDGTIKEHTTNSKARIRNWRSTQSTTITAAPINQLESSHSTSRFTYAEDIAPTRVLIADELA